jgi:hypothetical protein
LRGFAKQLVETWRRAIELPCGAQIVDTAVRHYYGTNIQFAVEVVIKQPPLRDRDTQRPSRERILKGREHVGIRHHAPHLDTELMCKSWGDRLDRRKQAKRIEEGIEFPLTDAYGERRVVYVIWFPKDLNSLNYFTAESIRVVVVEIPCTKCKFNSRIMLRLATRETNEING